MRVSNRIIPPSGTGCVCADQRQHGLPESDEVREEIPHGDLLSACTSVRSGTYICIYIYICIYSALQVHDTRRKDLRFA